MNPQSINWGVISKMVYSSIKAIDFKKETTADRVFSILRQRIVSMELKPHELISRSDLAKAFGVSQTPVREAILRLEEIGLVNVFPQSKTEIAPINPARILETQFLRRGLEIEAALRVSEIAQERDFASLEALIDQQQSLLDDDDQLLEFMALDRRFHRTLFALAGYESIHDLIIERAADLDRLRRLQLPLQGKRASIIDDHRTIIDALRAGRSDLIIAALHGHMGAVPWALTELQQQYPDYFIQPD